MSLHSLLSHISFEFSSLFPIPLSTYDVKCQGLPALTWVKYYGMWVSCVPSFFCLIRLPAPLRSTLIYLAGLVWFYQIKKQKWYLIQIDLDSGFRIPNSKFLIPNSGQNLYHFYGLKQWTAISLKHRKTNLLHSDYMIYPLIIAKYLLINIEFTEQTEQTELVMMVDVGACNRASCTTNAIIIIQLF